MTDAAEFRRRAQQCLDMAPKFSTEQRALIVSIAEAWIALAEAELAKDSWNPTRDGPHDKSNGSGNEAH
jgi:hypothetical protein